MSYERTLAIGMAFGSGLLLFRLGPPAIVSWRVYRGTGTRRQADAGSAAPATPLGVADRLNVLAGEGYRPIGVTRLELPSGTRFAWIAAAEDADSYAILAGGQQGPGLTGLYSAWLDGTWLGTQHPAGQSFDRAGLHVRIVATSLTDAVRAHREAVAKLSAIHGMPRQVRSMADMLALDSDYRTRFGGARLRPMTIRIAALAAAALIVFVLAIVLVAIAPA